MNKYRNAVAGGAAVRLPAGVRGVGHWVPGPDGDQVRPVHWPTTTVAGVTIVVAGVQDDRGRVVFASASVAAGEDGEPLDAVDCRRLAAELSVAADRLDRLRLS